MGWLFNRLLLAEVALCACGGVEASLPYRIPEAVEQPYAARPVGGYLECDGASALTVSTPGILEGADGLTIEALVRVDGNDEYQQLIDLGGPGPDFNTFLLMISKEICSVDVAGEHASDPSAILIQAWDTHGAYGNCLCPCPVNPPETWIHVAAVWDFRPLPSPLDQDHPPQALYFDGKRELHGWGSGPQPQKDHLSICSGAFSRGLKLTGAIDELRISRGARYSQPFRPEPISVDEQTLLLMHFDDLTEEVEGRIPEITGQPRIVRQQ